MKKFFKDVMFVFLVELALSVAVNIICHFAGASDDVCIGATAGIVIMTLPALIFGMLLISVSVEERRK